MAYKTIFLKANGLEPQQKEAKVQTAKTIYPGMLVEYVTNDETVQPHSTKAGNAALMVAIENALEGDEIGDSYAAGERCQYVHLRPGDEFLAYIADGENIAFGDLLESNGDGYFKEAGAESSQALGPGHGLLAMALEACAAHTSAVGATLIKAVAL